MNFVQRIAKTFKIILGSIILLPGVCILPISIIGIIDPSLVSDNSSPDEDRGPWIALLFLFAIPTITFGCLPIWDVVRQNKREKREQKEKERQRLRQIFFDLVQQQDGIITLFQFAIAAQSSGKLAQKYLDEFAQEYNATYQVDEEGNIFYRFNLLEKPEQENCNSDSQEETTTEDTQDEQDTSNYINDKENSTEELESEEDRELYTADWLERNFDSFQEAKDYYNIKAIGWEALAYYLNEGK